MDKLSDISQFHPHTAHPTDISHNIYMSSQGYKNLMDIQKDGKNLYWTTDINMELPIKMGTTGPSAQIRPDTIPNAFLTRAK